MESERVKVSIISGLGGIYLMLFFIMVILAIELNHIRIAIEALVP